MARRRIVYLISLLGCVTFYIGYQEWFSWLTLLTVLGLPWFSLLLSLPGMLTFRASITAPESVPMGNRGEAWLSAVSDFPTPPFRGRLVLTRRTTAEQWQKKMEHPIPTDHCGGIAVTAAKVQVFDYLALFRFRMKRPVQTMVIVRPEPVPVELPSDLKQHLALNWKPKPGGGFSENHELRLYRPGDGLNHVHWKLTAKTGKLIIREPMEPVRGRMVLTMDVKGTPEELDRKFGRLLWLGSYLLERNITFELRALTAEGIFIQTIAFEQALKTAIDQLLCCTPAGEGSIRDREFSASWLYHIGGDAHEA